MQKAAGKLPNRRGRPAKASGRFVEVRLAGVSSASAYEVVLARGRSIRIPSEFDPQIVSRLIVAVEPADFRKGIDGLARLCKEALKRDPFGGGVFAYLINCTTEYPVRTPVPDHASVSPVA